MRIDYIKELKRLVSCRDILEMYSIPVNDKGFASCIFHNERTASMKVYDGDCGFYCFGCGKSGDCVDLVQRLFDLNRYNAAKKINLDFHLHLPIGEQLTISQQIQLGKNIYEQRKRRQKKAKERAELAADYDAALEFYTACEYALKNLAPTEPDEKLNPLFIYAQMNIARAEYELELQETRRWKYDQRNRGSAMDTG